MLNRQAELFAGSEAASSDTTFRLAQLEVYNWGPFRGLHRAEIDPYGTAVIGPTGSGKTTLVDALMTLLVAQPKYNLASTGGHESDRTLLSYIRGALGGDGTQAHEEVARPGRTITGICANYRCGGETLRLAGLLWIDGPGNAADNLKRRWLYSQADGQDLEQWLRLLHEDGIRELMRTGRETAKLRIFESKEAYLTTVRKFFDVGENAFKLLNRAAGLKQLNSIDEIFRELVLDDRSSFDRALEVAGEFDNLAAIHEELEAARRQQESLVPVAEEYQTLLKARAKVDRFETLKRIVPIWYALVGRERWTGELKRIAAEREGLQAECNARRQDQEACRTQVDALRERYLQLGGNAIGDLEKTIVAQELLVDERRKHAATYQRIVAVFGLGDDLSPESLQRNQDLLREKRVELKTECERQWEIAAGALAQQHAFEKKCGEFAAALEQVKRRPGSNIPLHFQDFRQALAAHLGISDADVPFLAELVEVMPAESAWRGAVERAIGSERLRILIPEDRLDRALRWVNDRDNRLHVRLRRARHDEQPGTFLSDGYTRKLNFKNHPLINAAKRHLADRDLHCVASPEVLQTVEHGLTIRGLMSGRRGMFEKHDQRRLDQDWMTGFDNKDQLQSLSGQLKSAQDSAAQWRAEAQKQRAAHARLDERLKLIDQLVEIEFSTINLPGAAAELARSQERLKALLDPESEAGQAKRLFDAASEQLKGFEEAVRRLDNGMAKLDVAASNAKKELHKAEARIGRGLSEDEKALADKHLAVLPDVSASDLVDAERDAEHLIEKRLGDERNRVAETEQRLVRHMVEARRVDNGALADVGSFIDDVPHYLERLRVLNEEALPDKRRRFLEYLNRSSDQGVTQLLAGIAEEVDAIEQRIKELNQTLVKVDFRLGRYLQLHPQRIVHERLRSLEAAMRKVRSAALKDDEGRSHFEALRDLVSILREAGENRRVSASRALLDPRYRLEFFVVEVDRQTGGQSPRRTGSQSGSGGEKELMASHILTASLSYALCPTGADQPLYGTIVLDEAFSKSSPSAAGRIIEALRIFKLHPIFVTPNKEIGLLKRHTRKVICVQRPAKEASLASISWERLEEMAPQS